MIRVGLTLNFESDCAHKLLINFNFNSTFAKSLNLNLNSGFCKVNEFGFECLN